MSRSPEKPIRGPAKRPTKMSESPEKPIPGPSTGPAITSESPDAPITGPTTGQTKRPLPRRLPMAAPETKLLPEAEEDPDIEAEIVRVVAVPVPRALQAIDARPAPAKPAASIPIAEVVSEKPKIPSVLNRRAGLSTKTGLLGLAIATGFVHRRTTQRQFAFWLCLVSTVGVVGVCALILLATTARQRREIRKSDEIDIAISRVENLLELWVLKVDLEEVNKNSTLFKASAINWEYDRYCLLRFGNIKATHQGAYVELDLDAVFAVGLSSVTEARMKISAHPPKKGEHGWDIYIEPVSTLEEIAPYR